MDATKIPLDFTKWLDANNLKLPLLEVYRYLIEHPDFPPSRKRSYFPRLSLSDVSGGLDIPSYLVEAALMHLRELNLIDFYSDLYNSDRLIFLAIEVWRKPAETKETE